VQKARKNLDAKGASTQAEALDSVLKMLESQKPAAAPAPAASAPAVRKIMLRAAGRMILVSQNDICFASIEDGVITVITASGIEGQSNCRTLEELAEQLDPNLFWRAHRSYLVNINRIREVVPWFKSSYQIKMDDKKQSEVPVSRAQTKRLRELFRL
jgi:two-component system LytT family response regulator/two-component system response regulator LytT